jgi:hypothetical protein
MLKLPHPQQPPLLLHLPSMSKLMHLKLLMLPRLLQLPPPRQPLPLHQPSSPTRAIRLG